MAVSTGDFSKALWPGVRKWIGLSYQDLQRFYDKIAYVTPSDKAYEEIMSYAGLGVAAAIPSETGEVPFYNTRQGFLNRYTHAKYGIGFEVTEDAMDDDQYNVVERGSKEIPRSLLTTKEIIVHNVLNNAFSTTYGDGVSLCNSAHPNVNGGTWSNVPTTDADISEAALEDASISISNWTDDAGIKINLQPRLLIANNAQKFDLIRLFKTEKQVDTANNNINAIVNDNTFKDGFMTDNYITDTDAWFILTTLPKEDGIIYFDRYKGDRFDSTMDFNTRVARFIGYTRFVVGVGDPKCIFGCQGG